MSRSTNGRRDHIHLYVLPAATRLLMDAACKMASISPMGQIANVNMGQSPPGQECNDVGEGVPLLGGPADLGLELPEPKRWTTSPTKICHDGDILVCVRATIGEPRWSDGEYCIGRGLAAIRAKTTEVSSNFLFHVIEANQDYLQSKGTGTTFKTISKDDLEAVPVPLLPVNQQEAIGKFLGWLAKENGPEIDWAPSPKLPAAFDEQRRILAGVEHLSGMVERINILSRDLSISTESILQSSRNAIVTELRRGYPDTRLGDVCTKITDGPHVSPQYVDQGVPFISVRNVSETGIDFSTAKYVSPEDHALFSSKTHVEKGDVLYTKGGTTGVARRVDINREFSIWVHVALLKLKKEIVIPGYVEHMLNAPTSRTQAELFTHGSSNRDLGLSRMCNIEFPLAPLEEQFQIVSYLDGIMEKLASLRELQLKRRTEIEALMPSILDKAFKGEL